MCTNMKKRMNSTRYKFNGSTNAIYKYSVEREIARLDRPHGTLKQAKIRYAC